MRFLQLNHQVILHLLTKEISCTLFLIMLVTHCTFGQTSGGGVTDIDGNQYATVILGNQEWMAENLKTTKYSNGDLIEQTIDNTYWAYTPVGMWRHYNDSVQYEATYGKWYNWFSVIDPRNVCPTGWHVPYNNEWDSLAIYLGGAQVAGGKMKEVGFSHWINPNVGATNSSGFTALPAGYIGAGNFVSSQGMGVSAAFWTASNYNTESSVKKYLNAYNQTIGGGPSAKNDGLSVRCLKNQSSVGLQNIYFEKNKEIIRVFDASGREIEYATGKLMFIMFSDGSVDKVYVIEQ
jgi:uncharacterized protein (TIGR02145 family)